MRDKTKRKANEKNPQIGLTYPKWKAFGCIWSAL